MAYGKGWDKFWPKLKADLEQTPPEERDQFVQRQKDEIIRLTRTSKKEECLRVFKKIEKHKNFDLELVNYAIQHTQRQAGYYDPDTIEGLRKETKAAQNWFSGQTRKAGKAQRGFSRTRRKREKIEKEEFISWEDYYKKIQSLETPPPRPLVWQPGMESVHIPSPNRARDWLNRLLIDHFHQKGLTINDAAKLSREILATFLGKYLSLESVKELYYDSLKTPPAI